MILDTYCKDNNEFNNLKKKEVENLKYQLVILSKKYQKKEVENQLVKF